nr:hypothetical protein [Tanacetum cinerariifolium]
MAVCEPGVLDQIIKWKVDVKTEKLRVYLATFLHGMRGSTSSRSGRSGTDDYVGRGGSSQYNSFEKQCRNDLHILLRLSTQVGLLVRDELERLLDDDDMVDLYLSQKLFLASPAKVEADFLEVEQRVIDILKKSAEIHIASLNHNGLVFLVASDSTITHFPDEVGLVDSSGPSMSNTSASVTISHISSRTAKTGDGVQRGGVGVGMGINNNNDGSSAETTAFKNQHHQQGKINHNNTGGYSYQKGGRVSPKNKSM